MSDMRLGRQTLKHVLRAAYQVMPLPDWASRLLAPRCQICGYTAEYRGSRFEQACRAWNHWEALHEKSAPTRKARDLMDEVKPGVRASWNEAGEKLFGCTSASALVVSIDGPFAHLLWDTGQETWASVSCLRVVQENRDSSSTTRDEGKSDDLPT